MVESFFAFFGRLVLILSQSDHFAKAVCSLCIPYRPCKIADFQNCLISRLFGVFFRGVSISNYNVAVESFPHVFDNCNF